MTNEWVTARMNAIFDELISLFGNPLYLTPSGHKEICIKNKLKIPRVYYVGQGKTGSTSLYRGFSETAVHWHSEQHFETAHKTTLLSDNNICLYDLILYMGHKYDFKPLIIESYREPIARNMSMVAERHLPAYRDSSEITNYTEFSELLDERFSWYHRERDKGKVTGWLPPYSWNRWKDYFGISLSDEFDKNKNHMFKELENVKLLFLKLEDSKNWRTILKSLGYNYSGKKRNVSAEKHDSELYQEVLDNYRLPTEYLEELYGHEIIKTLYSEKEIASFIEKWQKDPSM